MTAALAHLNQLMQLPPLDAVAGVAGFRLDNHVGYLTPRVFATLKTLVTHSGHRTLSVPSLPAFQPYLSAAAHVAAADQLLDERRQTVRALWLSYAIVMGRSSSIVERTNARPPSCFSHSG